MITLKPRGTESDGAKKVPMELFHLFLGKPQCAMINDIYVSDKHLHKEIEIVYVLNGQVEIMIEDRVFSVATGEMLCIAGSVLHQYLGKQPGTDIAKIKFMKEWLFPPFFDPEEKEAYQQLYNRIFRTRTDARIQAIIQAMLESRLPQYNEYFYLGKLVELTAFLLAVPEVITENASLPVDNLRYMEAALTYMQDNCYEKLTLKMLADHLGLTESYCSKYIRRTIGITFVDYLNAMRVNNAQRLLIYTDQSITEIMERTGFNSVQTFNRVFKAQTGQSPSDYRKAKRKV